MLERLFLRRIGQLRTLSQSTDELDMLDAAGVLRQLLVDPSPLALAVNTSRIKLRFKCRKSMQAAPHLPEMQYVQLKPRNGVTEAVSLGAFLARIPVFINGRPVTVREIIKGASNALGGVHYDAAPRQELTDAVAMWRRMRIGSFPVGAAALNTIAEICLEALQPLVADVSARTEAASSPEEQKTQGTIMTIVEAEDGWHLANLVRPIPLVTSAGVSITGCIDGREFHLNVTVYGRVFYFNFVMPLDEIKDRFIPLFVMWDIDGDVSISSGKTLAAQPFNCPTTFRGKMTELPSLAKSPPQGSDR